MKKHDIMATKEPDLYALLESDPQSSTSVLKKNYQRLILQCHPDKQASIETIDTEVSKDQIEETNESFVRLTRAWNVLKDPHQRQQYDSRRKQDQLNQVCPVQDEVYFSEFTQASCEVSSLPFFTLDCRCGGQYFLHEDKVKVKVDIAYCDTCSLCVEVIYD